MLVAPAQVHDTLKQAMLVEGYPHVLDLAKSHGSFLHDAKEGVDYLDFFTFYSSRPVAFNHPGLHTPEFLARATLAAQTKPSNGDMYTTLYAEFVETFRTQAMGPGMKYLFFIDGGALAVENALKAAFDWKARKNAAAGKGEEPGKVLHFRHAFHGRSGYTISLTNTADPRKTQYFPRFDWPRVSSPALHFPVGGATLEQTIEAERRALAEIDDVYAKEGQSNIACILIEPIQCEGGDRHFRKEFLAELRRIADEREALLIFDEVQTGFGASGTMWYYEQIGVQPDLVAFSKKSQTGGVMASARLDDVDSVFRVKSRISSTFGGNLVDYVRCQRVLEIMKETQLLDNVKLQGRWLEKRLQDLVAQYGQLSNPRGVGVLLAVDAPDGASRDAIIQAAAKERLILLPCGDRSVRLRPALDVTAAECELAMQRIEAAVAHTFPV